MWLTPAIGAIPTADTLHSGMPGTIPTAPGTTTIGITITGRGTAVGIGDLRGHGVLVPPGDGAGITVLHGAGIPDIITIIIPHGHIDLYGITVLRATYVPATDLQAIMLPPATVRQTMFAPVIAPVTTIPHHALQLQTAAHLAAIAPVTATAAPLPMPVPQTPAVHQVTAQAIVRQAHRRAAPPTIRRAIAQAAILTVHHQARHTVAQAHLIEVAQAAAAIAVAEAAVHALQVAPTVAVEAADADVINYSFSSQPHLFKKQIINRFV